MSNHVTVRVIIGGVETNCAEIHTRHDVDQPIATGTLVMPAPRPAQVDFAVPVTIQAGYDDQVYTIFNGRVADDDATFSESGGVLRVALEGYGKYLWYKQQVDMTFTGMTALKEIFRASCAKRKVPLYYSDNVLYPNGQTANFGGNGVVNGGNVTIERDSSPGEMIDRFARLYGYRLYDTPIGYVRQKKISGLPSGTPFRSYTEGVDMLSVGQSRTLAGMVNYWEVIGARYTSTDGSEVALRSIPATVQTDPRLGPDGVNRDRIEDSDIVTLARADFVRNVQEIDRSTPYFRWKWDVAGDAELSPGHVVSVTSPTVGSNAALWLMSVAHSITGEGWTSSLEGWAGAGSAQPAGDDCVTQTLVGSGGFHLGNEFLAHYRRPNPDGTIKKIPFTVANDYTTLTITGIAHGCNSFVRNTSSTASRFEIWQPAVDPNRAVASGEMPRLNENLENRYPYGQTSGGVFTNKHWEKMTIPLSGSLRATVDSELWIISGFDSNVGDRDDFECANVVLRTCGVGQPIILT